ncbi:MAG TPA: FtsX-like permease family protein [Terriglobia bacterium]|nr:FtsX-like permease family protein [Terriglobia bacterium]
MKFLPLILRNTFRNRRRTILTILSISMSLFLISTLRTLLDSLESPPLTPDSATRVLTRHQTSLANTMPIAYRERIRHMPGVKDISAYQWVGAIYKDPANFFAQFAVDADRFFDIYTDIHVLAPEQKEAFLKERRAALAGVSLAKRYGWNIGDTVTMQGTFIPGDIAVIIRGFIKDGGSENILFLRYDYLNELWNDFNQTSTFVIKANSAEEIPAVIDTIDGSFMNSTAPTKTETEKAFVLGFVSMLGNVRSLVVSISTVLIFTIILVAANTMAMSIRERKGEIAILKTLGFSRGNVLMVLILESAFIALVGGLLGSLGARYILGGIDVSAMTTGFISAFDVKWETVAMAAGISLIVAFTSTFVPAWNASRVPIADAIRRRGE